MTPVFTRTEPLLLAGISSPLSPRSAPPPERPRVIQEAWRAFLPRITELNQRVGAERYAVIENDVRDNGAAPLYRAMVAVASHDGLPAWCERFTIVPGTYAAFTHKGLPRDFARTVTNIHVEWVPRIPGLFQSDIEIMVMPAGYDPLDPNGTFAYWLPLP